MAEWSGVQGLVITMDDRQREILLKILEHRATELEDKNREMEQEVIDKVKKGWSRVDVKKVLSYMASGAVITGCNSMFETTKK